MDLTHLDFEVFGIVQGVSFRVCTIEMGKSLNLVGWVKNTPQGTVQGQAEGPLNSINSLKHWLSHIGSPSSTISDARFSEHSIQSLSFSAFTLKH